MGCEIELKAHVPEERVEDLVRRLRDLNGSVYLGEIKKYDIYWSDNEEGEPHFRTRYESSADGERVLFTQKPMKKKDYCTEYNVENEFEAPPGEWERIQTFIKGIGLVICRIKIKNGYHFAVNLDNMELHSEVLNVKHLGWFIETEICGDDIEKMDKEAAEHALYKLLSLLEVPVSAVEPMGYNKMLKAVGYERG